MAFTEDTPPNSRLFVVCSKKDNLSESDFQTAFSKFGTIEDIWFVRDRRNQSERGLCYIKFSKSSEACLAMEELNGKSIGNHDMPLKIIIAANRSEGSVRKTKEAESINRIFIVVPQDSDGNIDSIRKHFDKFGKIDDLLMIKNKKFAYLTFSKASEAALAVEGCDRLKYKPRIADPPGHAKKRMRTPSPDYHSHRDNYMDDYCPPPPNRRYASEMMQSPMVVAPHHRSMPTSEGFVDLSVCLINNPTRCSQLFFKLNYPLSREGVWKLCSLIPGLKFVEIHQEAALAQKTIAYVEYDTPASAAWAWEKLQDFEYPPGYLIRIRYADGGFPADWQAEYSLTTGFHYNNLNQSNNLPVGRVAAINDAYNGHGSASAYGQQSFARSDFRDNPSFNSAPKTTAKLGPPKPILGRGTHYVDRVFVVCTNRIPMTVMEDAFSSFGDLIEFYYVANKNFGYATYASVEAVDKAIETLNGEMLHGERIKVVRAEPEPARDQKH